MESAIAIIFSKSFLAFLVFALPVGVFVGIALLVHLWKTQKVLRLNRSGLQFQQWGMWDAAITEFKRALDVDESHGVSLYNLSFALYHGRDCWKPALELLDRLIRIRPDMAEAFYTRGHLRFHRQKDSDGAEQDLRHALILDTSLAEPHNTLGLIRIQKQDWEAAVEEFKNAVEKNDKYEAAFANLGIGLVNVGKSSEAIDALEQCCIINPGNPLNHCNLGNAYGAARQHAKAIAAFSRAAELDPQNWSAHFWLGCVCLQTNDNHCAIPHFHRSLQLRGDFALAHYNLALCYEAIGDRVLARKHIDRAVELDPEIGKDLV